MKIDRNKVHEKYDKHCGYCGKEISVKEMQVDHIIPKWLLTSNQFKDAVTFEQIHNEENYMPACRRCNHYKREADIEGFREKLKTLHKRVVSHYIGKVAIDYGIVQIIPFNGVFYFETYNQNK